MMGLLEQLQFHPVPWATAIAASFVGVVVDFRCRRIPNKLTGPLLLAGILYSVIAGGGLVDSLAGFLVAGLPFFLLWVVRAWGAGDTKMMMALGAWLGFANGLCVLLFVALAGGAVALTYALLRRQVLLVASNMLLMVSGALYMARGGGGAVHDHRDATPAFTGTNGIPYGAAIFLGVSAAAVAAAVWGS